MKNIDKNNIMKSSLNHCPEKLLDHIFTIKTTTIFVVVGSFSYVTYCEGHVERKTLYFSCIAERTPPPTPFKKKDYGFEVENCPILLRKKLLIAHLVGTTSKGKQQIYSARKNTKSQTTQKFNFLSLSRFFL